MRPRLILLALLLTRAVRADLDQAQRLLDQSRYKQAYQEALAHQKQDPKRSELLQVWALANMLRGDEAQFRLKAFVPDARSARLFLIVHSILDAQSRRKDLEKALELCVTPAERVDVLLRLFRANPFPKDQPYWEEAAEIASRHRLPPELLARLSLAHINLLGNLKRPKEGFADLAAAAALLEKDPSRVWRIELARIELLNTLGRGAEARQARLNLPRLAPDNLRRLNLLMNLAEARSEVTQEQARRLLDMLPVLRDPLEKLYAFRIRSLVVQTNGEGQQEWRRQADALCRSSNRDERQIGFSERGVTLAAQSRFEEALPDLQMARLLAGGHPGSELYALAQPAPLSLALAQVELALQHYAQAEQWGRQALDQSGQDFNLFLTAGLCLMTVELRTAQLDRANQLVDTILQRTETVEAPLTRALAYFQLFNALMFSSFESNRSLVEFSAPRVDPDTPAGWLFARIRQDAQLQARIFAALDELKKQSSHPALKGVEGFFRGLVLGSLDRPLEAIDVYTEALERDQGYSPLNASIGLMLSQELWAAGQHQQAVPILQKALRQAEAGSPFVPIHRFRVALARQLLLLERRPEALKVLETGLNDPKDEGRASYLILRGRTWKNTADLQAALAAAKLESTRLDASFALHELEPQANWLERIRERSPKTAVRLMAVSPPARALEIGHESLEQFRDTFEQLPTAARPHALQSPAVQALIQDILEASIRANKPQDGAHCLAVWRALQSQPALAHPELEELRAELTGLRSSSDPAAAARLADTRARFLLKSNELRQLHPEMEKSLSAQVSELLALQPHLDKKTLLVQYFLAADGLYLQALTRDNQQLTKVSIEKARLLQLLERWRTALQSSRPLSAEALSASHQLYAHLIQPLATLRAGHSDLWIMPSAELWDLPFETLLDDGDHYLVETAGCAYLGPSEAMQMAQAPRRAEGFWLGVSNRRLPGTLQEIAQLKALFPAARETQQWAELKTLVGQAATLHLATHSQAQPARATESSLELAEGPVSMEQIYTLSLRPGSLVVLSSCSGAVPQTHRERDLISLSSGFRAAGASTVVAALWPIDDEATASFFAPMYRALQQNQSRLQSLRQAKQAMLAHPQYSHPYYWSGFTLLGDGR